VIEPTPRTTRSGRTVKAPSKYDENFELSFFGMEVDYFSPIEQNYYYNMHSIGELANCGINAEIMAVGTTGEQFNNTAELRPMKYEEAMALPSWAEWEESVDDEHERFKKHKVWRPVLKSEIPPGAKVLSSTWAMKQKADGTKRARLNARGY
jgi:hypothetical protein